jgi:hypothetical protein
MKKLLMVTVAAVLAMGGVAQAEYKAGTYRCYYKQEPADKGSTWRIAAPNEAGLPLVELISPGITSTAQPFTIRGYGMVTELPTITIISMTAHISTKHYNLFFESGGVRMGDTPCYEVRT